MGHQLEVTLQGVPSRGFPESVHIGTLRVMGKELSELQINALCLTQALLGVISSNFRFVSISRYGREILINILLWEPVDEDLEEIEDLKTEFEALMPGPVDFKVEVTISSERIILKPPSASTIVVFKRRE